MQPNLFLAGGVLISHNGGAEIHLHIVWHTKESLPLLTPQVEPFIHRYIRGRALRTPGLYFHAIGGTDNHQRQHHASGTIQGRLERVVRLEGQDAPGLPPCSGGIDRASRR